jgi:hypothetical protein
METVKLMRRNTSYKSNDEFSTLMGGGGPCMDNEFRNSLTNV